VTAGSPGESGAVQLDVNLEPHRPIGALKARLAVIRNRVMLAYSALNQIEPTGVQVESPSGYNFCFGDSPKLDSEGIANTKRWVVASSFADAFASIEKYLDQLARVYVSIELLRKGRVRASGTGSAEEMFQATLSNVGGPGLKRILKDRSVVRKAELISETYGSPVALLDEFRSLNTLRNCLVHRLGLVGDHDCKSESSDCMVVKYRAVGLAIRRNDRALPVVQGFRVERGDELLLQIGLSEELLIAKGNMVDITLDQYQHMLMTLFFFGMERSKHAVSLAAAIQKERLDPSSEFGGDGSKPI